MLFFFLKVCFSCDIKSFSCFTNQKAIQTFKNSLIYNNNNDLVKNLSMPNWFFFKDLSNKTSFVEIRWKTAKIWSIWREFWFHGIFVNIAILSLTTSWRKFWFHGIFIAIAILTAIWRKFWFHGNFIAIFF